MPPCSAVECIVACAHCEATFSNNAQHGRHVLRRHQTAVPQLASSLTPGVDAEDEILDENVDEGVAASTFEFYELFKDDSVLLFENEPDLTPPVNELCVRARYVLRYCCAHQSTLGEVRNQYLLETSTCVGDAECACQHALRMQFTNANNFAQYVGRSRRLVVRGQSWRTAVINTTYGINRTGAYRPVITIVSAIIANA